MKIFVTGGTGFIGGHFLRAALNGGHRVLALRRLGSRTRVPLTDEPQWVDGNLDDDLSAALSGCEALVHLAALGVSPQKAGWRDLFAVNVQQSLCLWMRAVEAGVRRFVICGSCLEYGTSGERYDFIPTDAPLDPITAYAASKAAASMAAMALGRERKIELLLLRPFHVFGEGQHESNFWPSLKAAALAGQDFQMTEGEQVRDFVPVEDVAEAFVASVSRPGLLPGKPETRNVGTGRPQTLRHFAEHWWAHWRATGTLRVGALPYRHDEVMRYAPLIKSIK